MSPFRHSLALMLGVGALFAADNTTTATTLTEEEVAFIQKAHACGLHEVQSAQIAIERQVADNDLAFANRMVAEHQRMSRELADLARAKQVALESSDADRRNELTKAAREKHEALRSADADNVAEKYLEQQIDAHEEAIEELEDIAEETQDAELRAYANRCLPTLRSHLQEAERLEAAH